jgi:hypothetical protein
VDGIPTRILFSLPRFVDNLFFIEGAMSAMPISSGKSISPLCTLSRAIHI